MILNAVRMLILVFLLSAGNAKAEDTTQEKLNQFFAGQSVSTVQEDISVNAQCIEQTSEKHVLTGKIVSSYLENSAAFILFETDNNKYTFPVNADKLIETRNLIGDVVSLGYVEKQYWDEYEEMCVNAVNVVEIKSLQSALQEPVERVLGNGNLEGTLLDVGEEAGFCYITIQESFEKSHLPINCGEMSSYVSLRGKDVTVTFTVNQYYYEPDDVWMKDFQIQKIVEW